MRTLLIILAMASCTLAVQTTGTLTTLYTFTGGADGNIPNAVTIRTRRSALRHH
jgi:hypothetical protein